MIFVNKMFQNNFERWNSACQPFNLTTLLSHIRVSRNFHTSEVRTKLLVKMSRSSLRVQIISCWRFDYVMRAPIWKIDWTIFSVLFTNITILKSEIFCAFRFFGSPSIEYGLLKISLSISAILTVINFEWTARVFIYSFDALDAPLWKRKATFLFCFQSCKLEDEKLVRLVRFSFIVWFLESVCNAATVETAEN